ncbi:cytochrome P450 [Paenibacillus sp. PR3]|uniref:Cytochrome P450 n=1 Tax=Paenibacillus terricola TaxID=2763503 RepID=A0ABR8N316_9BACL|nr:cytochrome P450 [Paenibacillus terricola]MBD3921666.1 cytochrome P450 [Paenibacillus terricola]
MFSYANLDLSSPEFKKNAHEIYKQLRQNEPLLEIAMPDGQRAWLSTRYDDAIQILKDDERFTKNLQSLSPEDYSAIMPHKEMDLISKQMLSSDPPDHARLRSIVSKAFSPQMIEDMQNEIQRITDDLIDRIQEKGSMEIIADFAFPLPIIVISQMLGIPENDHYLVKKWSSDFIESANNRDKLKEAFPSIQAFGRYIDELITERRKHPGSDLISMLIQAHDNRDRLTAEELSSTIWLLIVAGHETTVNLIGNGLLALLENPDQLRLWRSDPALAQPGIEELLRYYSPVEIATSRWARHDFTWHGKNVRKSDLIFVGLAAANRDPDQFENPDRLDITRKKNKHMAFGNGIHFCLGAPLARLEGKIALSTLLRRLPNLRIDTTSEELKWRSGILMRGLERFPVTF